MVETYNQNSNPNMRRPVVKEEVVDFMRQRLQPVTGGLKELEDFARAEMYLWFPMRQWLTSAC